VSIYSPAYRISFRRRNLDLSWSEPDDNGLPIIGYKIEYSSNGNSVTYTLVKNTNSNITFYAQSNITSDWYQYYKVYAINALGVGAAADWAQANLWEEEPGNTPGPPTNVNAEGKTCAVYLSWDPPIDDGGSPIIRYIIDYKIEGDLEWTSIIGGTTNTTYTHTASVYQEFVCGNSYCYRIRAMNANGDGEWSSLVYASPTDCYDDYDCDGLINVVDNCPSGYNPDQTDFDEDGIGDCCDNCRSFYNPDQADYDLDGYGDECDNNDLISPDAPGFECIILLFAIALFLIWKKK